jgi:hypothetical protein
MIVIILILLFTCFFVTNGFSQIQIGPLVVSNVSSLSFEPKIEGGILIQNLALQ